MSAEEMRKVVWKVCRAEKMEEVGICEKEVTQNPCGVVLTRVVLVEKVLWKEVADLEESLLANYTK